MYQEQVKHFSTPDGSLRAMTYEELKTLPVLDSVIRETLRIHPPIHSIMRKVLDDVAIPQSLASPSESGSYVVPKGHVVIASPAVSQIDPRVWPEPLKWWPERWTDPKGVAAQAFSQYHSGEKHDYGFGVVSKGTESPYQPFGAGRHRCIGEQVRSPATIAHPTILIDLFLEVCVYSVGYYHRNVHTEDGVPCQGWSSS